ncbi:MAG: tetratricopeptide repeat protein [Deltaproteobacteria bacterium]|nr:tetratricopeptide repeat protein [Deltaproteobacteria bacterium]
MPSPLDPEEALDLLGLDDEDAAQKQPEPDVLDVEFPPMSPVKTGAHPSAAVTGGSAASEADAKGRAAPRPTTNPSATPAARPDPDKERLQQQLKAAQEAEKKAAERAKRAEDELAAARREAPKGGDGGTAARERDALKLEVESLRAQVARSGAGASRMLGLPTEDDEGTMPKEGQLETFPYGRILVRALKDRFSGRLNLRSGTAKREVYFEDGAPVAYSSSEPGERLGRVLVTNGIITEDQYLAAARAMVERGAKLTEALLEMGALDSQRLQTEQRQLTRDQIVSGFALVQGAWSLEPGKGPADEVGKFEFRAGEIYLAGYRKYVPEGEIKTLFASIKDSYVRPRSEFTQFRPHLGLDQDDERILKLLGEAYTVDEAVERSGVAQERGARLLGALKMLGLITEWKPGVPEFEARLKAEKLRQAEEALALKQKLQEREEQLFSEMQKGIQRLEAAMREVQKAMAERPAGPAVSAAPPAAASEGAGHGKPSSSPALTPAAQRKEPSSPPPSAEPAKVTGTSTDAAAEDGPGQDRYKEGMRQAAAGRLDEAETALREAVRLDATKPSYLTALARVLLANPRYERAGTLPVVRSLLDRAAALAPGDAEVAALLQRIQSEMT